MPASQCLCNLILPTSPHQVIEFTTRVCSRWSNISLCPNPAIPDTALAGSPGDRPGSTLPNGHASVRGASRQARARTSQALQPMTGYQHNYYKSELVFEPGQLGTTRERVKAIVLSERRFKSTCIRTQAEEHGRTKLRWHGQTSV